MVPPDFSFDPTELNRGLGLTDPERAVRPADAEILLPLAHQLVSCPARQLPYLLPDAPPTTSRSWRRDARPRVHKLMTRLIDAGLATEVAVRIEPHRPVEEPLSTWNVGDPAPDAADLSARIADAWAQATAGGPHPPTPTGVYRATPRGVVLMGAFPGGRNAAELSRHRLRSVKLACGKHPVSPPGGDDARSHQSVTRMFLSVLRHEAGLARGWRLLHRRPTELLLPDALVYDERGAQSYAVAYATHWCPCLVGRFHQLCSSRGMPYRIYGG